jgi:hypothetical protein
LKPSQAVLLVTATTAAYANAFLGVFQFDDYNVIVDNPAVHSLAAWWRSMPGIRPLLKLSYALNWTSGLGIGGFHAVNLLCHLGSTLLVFALARRCVQQSAAAAPPDAVALSVALLFALHPAQTEAVTYICGRSVTLMAVPYLGAVLLWLSGRERDSTLRQFVLSPALFLAALATKETAWTLPFALLLLELTRPDARMRETLWKLRAHFGLLAAAAVAMLAVPGYRRLLEGSITARTLKENLLAQIDGVIYLAHPLLLLRTNIDPDLIVPSGLTPLLALKAALLLGLAATGVLLLRRRPWLGLGLLWFFLHLAPTNSVLPRLDIANDRQLYLASIGPALIASVAIWSLAPGRIAVALTGCAALVLGAATVLRNQDYRSEVALWQATVDASPGKARAWNNLGFAYRLAGDDEAARRAYLQAVRRDPGDVKARANLDALTMH